MGDKTDTVNSLAAQDASQKSKQNAALKIVGRAEGPDDWKRGLKRMGGKSDGRVERILRNAIHALRHALAWRGVFQYDTLALQIRAIAPPPFAPLEQKRDWKARVWTDDDDRRTTEWLQGEGVLVGTDIVAAAVETVAMENKIWPVRDYLRGLSWDGTPRIDNWLVDYFGASDCEYHRVVGAKWLLSAVARAMLDEAKVDTILILEGAQGIGKGRAIEALVPHRAWYTDSIKEFLSIEAARQLAGKWIVESSELEGIKGASGKRRAEEGVKAFLSRTIDNYRAPWGRRAQDHPRRCVFVGTTNRVETLTDVTGNRRFWPVKCGAVKADEIKVIKDQLWAETFSRFSDKSRRQWWLTPEEQALATEMQEARMEVDILESDVIEILGDQESVTQLNLAKKIFSAEAYEISRQQVGRLDDIMEHLKWKKDRSWKKETYGQVIYIRPKSAISRS